jgi:hypothetical protein
MLPKRIQIVKLMPNTALTMAPEEIYQLASFTTIGNEASSVYNRLGPSWTSFQRAWPGHGSIAFERQTVDPDLDVADIFSGPATQVICSRTPGP